MDFQNAFYDEKVVPPSLLKIRFTMLSPIKLNHLLLRCRHRLFSVGLHSRCSSVTWLLLHTRTVRSSISTFIEQFVCRIWQGYLLWHCTHTHTHSQACMAFGDVTLTCIHFLEPDPVEPHQTSPHRNHRNRSLGARHGPHAVPQTGLVPTMWIQMCVPTRAVEHNNLHTHTHTHTWMV